MYQRKYTDAEKAAYWKRKAMVSAKAAPARRAPAKKRAPAKRSSSYKYPGLGRKIGGTVGGMAGNYFAPGIGGAVGGALGSVVGDGAQALVKRITGFGDYTVSKNSLVYNRDAVPEFSAHNERCTVITHREFITDIKSSITFNLNSYRINPAIQDTFPWLSAIAQNYEQYVVQGMVFEYKTISATAIGSTNTALGTVIMATQYNSLSPLFDNKQQMENYEFCQSSVPSQSILHAIECDPTQTQCGGIFNMYDVNAESGDTRLYDIGRFNIATVGMQTADVPIGELWVSYKICLLKPRLTGVTDAADFYTLLASSVSSANILGTYTLAESATFNSEITTLLSSTKLGIDASFVGLLQITYAITYDTDMSVAQLPTITVAGNCSVVTDTFTATGSQSVNGKASSNNAVFAVYYVKCNGGYVPSTGQAPVVTFANATFTGDAPLTAVLSIISMPDNMTGSL